MECADDQACIDPQDCCVLLMARLPVLGRVKTRLARAVGDEHALELYRCFVLDTLAVLDTLSASLIVCFTPEDGRTDMARWLGEERTYLAQQGSDLGERMDAAFTHAFARGYARVLLVGSDIPGLSAHVLEHGLIALGDHDACLAPAQDGGYYCIGFTRSGYCPEVFRNMVWSTGDVFVRTCKRLEQGGASLHLLPLADDVDTVSDLAGFWQRSATGTPSLTRAYLERTGLGKLLQEAPSSG
ncbi:TIGR04282 family arsenosugar biosynthesis glycosyltransferase [Desulfoplanes formicivorans]|uniref:Glycosyltransferase n=1 Tax=Desulfoplanes formicivorans TaxID=1592317 RepID=A0A194AM87_9BACT|nr:TIGR04282 family arsenosugar biosynthesis glycosyltransferase [Desulfoplanes formicivorans]GAU09759.1 hypothetical protein DPF_2492 [Desulfoplanes formicivorans]